MDTRRTAKGSLSQSWQIVFATNYEYFEMRENCWRDGPTIKLSLLVTIFLTISAFFTSLEVLISIIPYFWQIEQWSCRLRSPILTWFRFHHHHKDITSLSLSLLLFYHLHHHNTTTIINILLILILTIILILLFITNRFSGKWSDGHIIFSDPLLLSPGDQVSF